MNKVDMDELRYPMHRVGESAFLLFAIAIFVVLPVVAVIAVYRKLQSVIA